jgi:PAS domain S-box-containing protein
LGDSIRILVIDDEPHLLDIAKEWLEGEMGFEVATASSAEEGLAVYRSGRQEAIISDYQMPGMNGLDLLRFLRGEGDSVPFILFTGKGREEVAMEALEAGADGYHQKGQQSRPQFATLAQKVVVTVGKHRAEDALRESEQKWRGIVNTSPDGIAIVSLDGRIAEMSDSALAIYGFDDASEIVGRDMFEFLDPSYKDKATLLLGEMLKGHYTGPSEYRVFTKDGSPLILEINADVLRDKNGAPIAFMLVERDITRRRLAEEQLLKASKKLNLMNSVTRHDTLNQIMAIRGYARMLEKRPLSPEMAEQVRNIERSAHAIERQMEFMKEYQEIGAQEPRWMELEDCVRRSGETIPSGAISVEVRAKGVEIWADPMFEKVVHNLLDNALRHGHAKRLVISKEVEDGNLRLVFADDGLGVAEKDRQHLFERGYGRNTGFGLFLAKEILGMTGIDISEESSALGGARFVMSIPAGLWR